MLFMLSLTLGLTMQDLVKEVASKQPASLIVDFIYTDKSIQYDPDRKRQGTTEDRAKGRLVYKNGKYRLDVVTNRWITTYTTIYDGVDTLVFHDNYPDSNNASFNQVNYYDSHYDGIIRDCRLLMLTLPDLLFDSSVGVMSTTNTRSVNLDDEKALVKHVLRCKSSNSVETEALLSKFNNRIESANIYNGNNLLMSFRFQYPASNVVVPKSFTVRIVAADDPKEIGRTIEGEYTNYEVNRDIDEDLFKYKFPAGTLIRDLRKRNANKDGSDVTHVYIDDKTKVQLPTSKGYVSDKIRVILQDRAGSKYMIIIISCVTILIIILSLTVLYRAYKRRSIA